MKPLTQPQFELLQQVREATDGQTALHKSGDASVGGLCARGSTIRSLERRALVEHMGYCMEIGHDGFAVTGNDDAPWYAITAKGREMLAALGTEEERKP